MTLLGYRTRLSKPTLRSLNCLPQFRTGHAIACSVRSGRSLIAVDPHAGRLITHGAGGDPRHGTECPVEPLSGGARDQLYLALRIAAVEAYGAQAEPLPFIADDVLVYFDDTRAAAAIALLAELGQTTQVILFTHHEKIVSFAERQAGVAVQALPPITVGPSNVLAVV